MKKEFNWGDTKEVTKNQITGEIFDRRCYEELFQVQKGDIVMDIGASIGPFTWSIMDKASKVYTIEPMEELQPLLRENTINQSSNVEIIQKIISYEDGVCENFNDGCFVHNDTNVRNVDSFTLKTFLQERNLNKIDFLKFDCEGGEYNLFTPSNINFLTNNVRNLVGEFHLNNVKINLTGDYSTNGVSYFRHFRDVYLPLFKQVEVRSFDGVDIKWDLYNEHFLEYYNEVVIHLSNEEPNK
tara:strand:+ start:4637 stop:5359 length:723 start_codon:yes stop_codon:yes gene_type:complete